MLVFFLLFASDCSASKSSLRIYGGRDASPGEYPYVVRLEIRRVANFTNNTIVAEHDHVCTASALTATWAVTAAHCITDLSNHFLGDPWTEEKLIVRYGHVDNSVWMNDTFSDVISTVPHPLYTYTYGMYNVKSLSENDIGLVETTSMPLKRFIKLSAVDYMSMYGHEAVIAGYGLTTKRLPGGKIITDDTLQLRKPLQVLSVMITKCSEYEQLLPSLCLAPRCGHTVIACGGDSGGPLIHSSGISGVLSLAEGSGYCLHEAPKVVGHQVGVMTPISPYIEWIYSYVRT
ncbi:trypsin eta-like [Battus philenor]|uniref:trypsin eta-like n=1 Tax=Battus philenor TaxID=42288 RepID=UPI0035D0F8E4